MGVKSFTLKELRPEEYKVMYNWLVQFIKGNRENRTEEVLLFTHHAYEILEKVSKKLLYNDPKKSNLNLNRPQALTIHYLTKYQQAADPFEVLLYQKISSIHQKMIV